MDSELMRALLPWMGLGFAATFVLGCMLDARGAIIAFGLGALAPVVVYLPPSNGGRVELGLLDIVLATLRAPVPFYFSSSGVAFVLELTLNWWLGGAFGAALAIYARRRGRKKRA